MDALLAQVHQGLLAHRALAPRIRVVVGVSGGPDSVTLLHLLQQLCAQWRWHLHVAHLDHALRQHSERDAQFVQQLSARWNIPVTVARQDVGALCARHGWSIEDGARRIRHQFLFDVAQQQSAQTIALAHTADDQAETVLMRMIRGTGLLGLGAMPMKRPSRPSAGSTTPVVWIVRPLLEIWRCDILAYLQRHRLAACADATNDDRRFVRNRIRHELLPLLERSYNPRIKGALTQLAQQSRVDYAYLEQAAGRQWKRVAKTSRPHHVRIGVRAFLRQPKALQRQLLRQAIHQVCGDLNGFEFRHWRQAERLFTEQPTGTRLDLPGGLQLRREAEGVVCQQVTQEPLRDT